MKHKIEIISKLIQMKNEKRKMKTEFIIIDLKQTTTTTEDYNNSEWPYYRR